MKYAKIGLPPWLTGALLMGLISPSQAQTPSSALTPLPATAPYAAEMNAFLKADQAKMPPSNAVLFMGSSSIRFWTTLAQDFPELPVINRGFGGSFIAQSTLYADRIAIPYKPKIIVLYAGTNDLDYGHRSPVQVLGDFTDFVAKIHTALPETRIVYLSIDPSVARWKEEDADLEANHLIETWINDTNSKIEKLTYIDSHSPLLSADGQPQPALLRSDGLHLNAAGYAVLVSIVKPRILALASMDGVVRLDTH